MRKRPQSDQETALALARKLQAQGKTFEDFLEAFPGLEGPMRSTWEEGLKRGKLPTPEYKPNLERGGADFNHSRSAFRKGYQD